MDTTRAGPADAENAAAWWVIGGWIRLAIAGGLMAFGGLAAQVADATLSLQALGLASTGAAVAALAAHMARRALDRLDAPSAPAASGELPAAAPVLPRNRRRAWAISP